MTHKRGIQCKLFKVALKERKPQLRSLYNVSMVIETKVVIG